MDLTDEAAYRSLGGLLDEFAQAFAEPSQLIYYLATPSFLFLPAATGLGKAGLVQDSELTRLVVEKPIGGDLASFLEIDQVFKQWLKESQLYRIDHYLGKETVQNILALRFANPIFA